MDRTARPRILVTRPEPGATATETALAARGFDVIKRPLTELAPVPVDEAAGSAFLQSDIIIVTSANALRFAPPDLLRAKQRTKLVAVGDATARQARDFGMSDVISIGGDADALIGEVLPTLQPGSNVGYLCGKLRRDTIESVLVEGGFNLTIIETYETQKVSQITNKLIADFKQVKADAVAVFSGVSAGILAEAVALPALLQIFERKPVFVISKRASEPLVERWPGDIHISESMQADAMHELIENHFFGHTS